MRPGFGLPSFAQQLLALRSPRKRFGLLPQPDRFLTETFF
jgi:hypothetical protein